MIWRAHSIDNKTEPPHSPPTLCNRRRIVNRTAPTIRSNNAQAAKRSVERKGVEEVFKSDQHL